MTEADASAPSGSPPQPSSSRALVLLAVLAFFFTLYFAKALFLPVVLALLLSFLLAPVMRLLHRIHVPTSLGAALIVISLFSGVGWGAYALHEPAAEWLQKAPVVFHQLERKLYPIKQKVEQVTEAAEQVDKITSVEGRAGDRPIKVAERGIKDILYENAVGFVFGTLSVLFLLYFLLSWGHVLLAKTAGLFPGNRNRVVELAHVVEVEVSTYLFTVALINTGLAVVVSIAMYLLGMPNAVLWGVLAGVLNFIPYLGSLTTGIILTAAAALTFDPVGRALLVPATYFIIQTLEGQVLTPLVLGRRLALNPLMVFSSIVFWFWLWGIPGALMGVPILATVKLIADRVDGLAPLGQFLGR